MRPGDTAALERKILVVAYAETRHLLRYEGVPLSAFSPRTVLRDTFDIFRLNHWGIRDKLACSSYALDPIANGIVADMLNGRKLDEDDGFSFVATGASG